MESTVATRQTLCIQRTNAVFLVAIAACATPNNSSHSNIRPAPPQAYGAYLKPPVELVWRKCGTQCWSQGGTIAFLVGLLTTHTTHTSTHTSDS